MSDRPTFYYNGQPMRAGGVIFYKYDNLGNLYVMLAKYGDKLCDFGGKTDAKDTCLLDTIIREVLEETNGVINENELEFNLEKVAYYMYLRSGKYMLYFVEKNDIDPTAMGTIETHTGMHRDVDWYLFKTVPISKLHNRITYEVVNFLKMLDK